MYTFIQPNEQQTDLSLPSEALFLNGRTIEEQIKGYRTLSVTGRELLNRELLTERKSGGDGDLFISSSYPARIITIRYELKAQENDEFRLKFELLNRILYGEQKELKFADDFQHSFFGTLSDVGDIPVGRNTVVSSFSFYCSDPFKYKNAVTFNGTQSTDIKLDDFFLTLPLFIKVTPSALTNTLTLKTGNKQIKLVKGSFAANKEIVFDFTEQTIYSGSIDLMDKLELASNFEDFYLKNNQPVELVEAGKLSVEIRQVAL